MSSDDDNNNKQIIQISSLPINILPYIVRLFQFSYTNVRYQDNMATKTQEMLTLEGAKIAVTAAEKKAKEIGVDMNIAVVDASTHLLHFSRMPGAKITSISSMYT